MSPRHSGGLIPTVLLCQVDTCRWSLICTQTALPSGQIWRARGISGPVYTPVILTPDWSGSRHMQPFLLWNTERTTVGGQALDYLCDADPVPSLTGPVSPPTKGGRALMLFLRSAPVLKF